MMLLASIGTGKELHTASSQFLITGIMDILHTLVDEV